MVAITRNAGAIDIWEFFVLFHASPESGPAS